MMAIEIEIQRTETVSVRFLQVEVDPRYWEDASVNGACDEKGTLIPCRAGNKWAPTIDLETGRIEGWPADTFADIHYKVCDAGRYALLDESRNEVRAINGYVPDIMCPQGGGYGDYIIMHVGPDGVIRNFEGTALDDFTHD